MCGFPVTLRRLQGAKRDREVSPSGRFSPEAQAGLLGQTGIAAPPAKRVRAPTAVADATSVPNLDTQQPMLLSTSQKPAEDHQAHTGSASSPPTSAVAAPSVAPQQQHTARVAVMQQDPERVQVKIEMPSSVVQLPHPPQQVEVAQAAQQVAAAPSAATPGEVAEVGDVDMAEGTAPDAAPDAATTPEPTGDDAEDGELPDADAAAADEVEAPETQMQASLAAGDSAAAGAGQGATSEADVTAGRTGRKPVPIVYVAPGGASEPPAPVTTSQPRPGGTPASGTQYFMGHLFLGLELVCMRVHAY